MRDQLIVVVEDERLIADLIREILGLGGYLSVVVFDNPTVALKRIGEDLTPALIVSDFHMPGMNGKELLDAALERHPHLRGILVTADPDGARAVSERYTVLDKADVRFHERLLQQVAEALRHYAHG